jgi:hypothetical protein
MVNSNKIDRTDVKCVHCGHEWEYKGTSPMPTCPNCVNKTKR